MSLWPWFVVAGLGAFHGLNPAMGWLFAVALGLYRSDGRTVALALIPIALGHFLAVGITVVAFLAFGLVLEPHWLRNLAALALLGWAVWHGWRGSRHRVRFGMRIGALGLVAWSTLMALTHGAGLMLIPALIPICFASGLPAGAEAFAGSLGLALLGVLVHSAAMLVVAGVVALVIWRYLGLAILRHAWINFDRLWITALIVAAIWLILG